MADEPSTSGAGSGKPSPTFGDLFWVGTACAISVVGAGAVGYGLDSAFGTLPWLTFVGLGFGIASAVLLAVNQLRKFL
jgi:hypothetical protein